MNDIRITIVGAPGTGKTSIARLVKNQISLATYGKYTPDDVEIYEQSELDRTTRKPTDKIVITTATQAYLEKRS